MRRIYYLLLLVGMAVGMASCSEETDEWDPYANWAARNAEWFLQINDSARTNADGRWMRYKSLFKAQDQYGSLTDSICVHVLASGQGTEVPVWTDSVRVNFRGWLMPTTYRLYNAQDVEVDSVMQQVFTQTYFGPFDPQTAAPQLMNVADLTEGFGTALQYMREGDDWLVYIPQQLGYKAEETGDIPPYSTLCFRINLVGVYHVGETAEQWN